MTYYRPVKSSSTNVVTNSQGLNSSSSDQIIPIPSNIIDNNNFDHSNIKYTKSSTFFKEKVDVESGNDPSYSNYDKVGPTSSVNSLYSRPVIIFGWIDLSRLTPWIQYIILSSGLLVFMCLYGYYQELVAYNYFERKLTIFSTFLHFLGCWLVAHGQRRTIQPSKHHHIGSILSMGTAPSRIGIFYYCLLIGLKTLSQGLTNLSMTQINYPAKVLFKSATPIINMIIGLFWFRRSYFVRDYIVVCLLVFGLYVFVNGDANASPEGTRTGIVLVSIAMFSGAAVPMIQEYCINKYNATVEELLYHSFLGSTIISFFLSLLSGELADGTHFILIHGNIYIWSSLILFSTVGFCGSNFSTGLTLRFGSLVNGITNTARKAVNIGLSFALFPSRNHLTHQHIVGAIIFFSGLIVRTLMKESNTIPSNPIGYIHSSDSDISTDSSSLSSSPDDNGQLTNDTNSITKENTVKDNFINRGSPRRRITITNSTDQLAVTQEREDDLDVEIGPILTANILTI